jgi:hypothetical protein
VNRLRNKREYPALKGEKTNDRSCTLAHPPRSACARFLVLSARTGLIGNVRNGSIAGTHSRWHG